MNAPVKPPIERHSITSREQWLALRQKDITASVAGALLGVHEYETPYSLWAQKSGRISEGIEDTPPMKRGRLLEPVAVELMRELRPTWKITRGDVYLRDPNTRLGATPDVFVEDPDRGPGIVQIKSVESMTFRRKWRGDDGEVRPPLWIAVQAIVEAHLTGAKWVGVAPLVVNHGLDMPIIDDIPLHGGVIERLKRETAAFWKRVESGDAPPADYTRDGEIIAELYGVSVAETVDLSGDARLIALMKQDKELAATASDTKELREAVKAEIIEKLGHNALALCDGWKISAPTTNRKAYSVAASSYRAVRITPPKE